MEATKAKRVRKKKEIPDYAFKRFEGKEEIIIPQSLNLSYSNDENIRKMSTKSDLIPLIYIFCNRYNGNSYVSSALNYDLQYIFDNDGIQKGYIENIPHQKKILLCKIMGLRKPISLNDAEVSLKSNYYDYLAYNEYIPFEGYSKTVNEMNLAEPSIHRLRFKGGSPFYYSFLTLVEKSSRIIPYFIPVILPEDLIYQKVYYMNTGTVDFNRVTVLIAKELEDPSFEKKNLKAIYKKKLLPLLENLNVDVMWCPAEKISDLCFIPEFKLPDNLKERKEAVSAIIAKSRINI